MIRFTRAAVLLAALATAFAADDLKIALLCTGSVTDGGWNQLAKEGLDQVQRTLCAKVSVLQKVSQEKAGDELRDYAAEGYDLVIAHGYEYLNPAAEAAKSAGAMRIAVCGADVARDGIATIDFDLSHASYQVGILAARLSKTGKLGFIGGAEIPSVKACYRGFLAGARSVRPDISAAYTITSWDQPQQSKAQAEALMAQGVDAIYHDVDAACRGVFEAIRERNAKGGERAWVFGCVADQNANPICPDAIVASAVIRLGDTFLGLAKSVQDGTFAPGLVQENIARGICVLVLNPTLLGSVVSAELQGEVDAAGRKLAAGEITIPAQ